jgi:hypothetical protein
VNSYCEQCKAEAGIVARRRARDLGRKYRQDPEVLRRMRAANAKWKAAQKAKKARYPRRVIPALPLREAFTRLATERDVAAWQLWQVLGITEAITKWTESSRLTLDDADAVLTKLNLLWWDVYQAPTPTNGHGTASEVLKYIGECEQYLVTERVFSGEAPV